MAIVSLQQASLLTPSSKLDGIPRLNGYLVRRESKFIKVLESRLVEKNFRNIRELWLSIQLVKVLGLRFDNLAKVLDHFFMESLATKSDFRPSIIGTLLSLVSDDKNSVAYLDSLRKLDSSELESCLSDITFLEGLEMVLLKLSKYGASRMLLTLELPLKLETSRHLSHRLSCRIFHVRHTPFERHRSAYCCLLLI